MRARDERTAKQLLKTSGADVSSSWKKLKKPQSSSSSLLRPRVKSSQRDLKTKVDGFPEKTKV